MSEDSVSGSEQAPASSTSTITDPVMCLHDIKPISPSVSPSVACEKSPTQLSVPEELLVRVDSEGTVELTWFFDELFLETFFTPDSPYQQLFFEVKQQSVVTEGRVRTRLHTCPCCVSSDSEEVVE